MTKRVKLEWNWVDDVDGDVYVRVNLRCKMGEMARLNRYLFDIVQDNRYFDHERIDTNARKFRRQVRKKLGEVESG